MRSTIRRLHVTGYNRKNPYYFYDLAGKQPRSSYDPDRPFFSHGLGKAGMIFGEMGSREHARRQAQSKTQIIAGVSVPPKPEEPTNCCMSGCINCVWEGYKDELEDWRRARNRAKRRLCEAKYKNLPWPVDYLGPEPNRAEKNVQLDDDSWQNVDIAIQVFVETEKRIREKHRLEKEKEALNDIEARKSLVGS